MKTKLALSLLCCFHATAGIIVFENTYASANGNSDSSLALANNSVSIEFLMAGSQFAAIPTGADITALGFRATAVDVNQPVSTTVYSNYSIELSTSQTAIGSMSNNFSNNLGSDATIVRSGPLTIGQNAFPFTSGPGPNGFYYLTFTTPYVYQGGDLLLTLQSTHTSGSGVDLDAMNLDSLVDSAVSGGSTEFFTAPVMAFQFQASSTPGVPEPSGLALTVSAGFGLWGLAIRRKRR